MTCQTGRALVALLEAEIADAGSAIEALNARRARLSAALAALRDDPDILAGSYPVTVTVGGQDPPRAARSYPVPGQARMLEWARARPGDGWFTAREAAAAMRIRRTSAAKILRRLVEAGSVVTNGKPPRSTDYAYRALPGARQTGAIRSVVDALRADATTPPAPAPVESAPAPPEPVPGPFVSPTGYPVPLPPNGRRSKAETEALIRDYARRECAGEWFTKKALAQALGYRDSQAVSDALRALIARGTIITNGTPARSSSRAYRFAGRPEPSVNGNGAGKGERASGVAPVAGTGKGRTASTAKDYAAVIARARARGWRVEAGNGGHDRLIHRNGSRVSLSRSPSDRHAATSLETTLRRMERDPQTARS